jgi:general secretion pathway protein E
LSEINRADRNIMTLEDPVEYQIAGIRQAHVDIKAGLTFGVGLRSILRQDPDVIMIGEIRDLETAQIAIQSALTGHLVFSTLHTNDAPSTVTRMVDMGIEPYLISSSLTAIIAQRLLRKLCESCKKPYRPGAGLLKRLGLPEKDYTFYEEKGCPQCRDTGFRGRIGIYELFVPSREIKQMINDKSSAVALNRAAVSEGFVDLKHDGIEKVVMGVSSITELLRVI